MLCHIARPMIPATDSRAKAAVKAGGAAVLICTGVVIFAGRLFVDVVELIYGQPFGFADSRFLGMMLTGLATPILVMAVPAFTLYLATSRCRSFGYGLVTTVIALLLMVGPFALSGILSLFHRGFWLLILLYPAVLLGIGTGSWVGWYLGAVIQLGVGAWLLGWLDRFRSALRDDERFSLKRHR